MAEKSRNLLKQELLNGILDSPRGFADNNSGNVSPEVARERLGDIIDSCFNNVDDNRLVNVGFADYEDIGVNSTVDNFTNVGGDVSSCEVLYTFTADTICKVTFANPMPSTDYIVRIHVRSMQTAASNEFNNYVSDWNLRYTPSYRVLSETEILFGLSETVGKTQDIRVYFETVRI